MSAILPMVGGVGDFFFPTQLNSSYFLVLEFY